MAGEIMTLKIQKDTNSPAPAAHIGFDDRRMETMMGRLLQVGVLLASTVVLVGGFLYLKEHRDKPVDYRTFTGESAALRHPTQLLHLLAAGDAAAIVQLGILLLIATPIARVFFAVIGFAIERDRFYVCISLVVLSVLLFSLFR
jgi:uncharacterized membrane protein